MAELPQLLEIIAGVGKSPLQKVRTWVLELESPGFIYQMYHL